MTSASDLSAPTAIGYGGLDEERIEAGHDPFHKIDEFLGKWDKRFTLDNPRFADRYAKREAYFVLIFQWVDRTEEYVAIFQAYRPLGLQEEIAGQRDILRLGSVGMCDADLDLPRRDLPEIKGDMCTSSCEKDTVLVGDVQLVEDPEITVPTLVWVQPLDRFLSGLTRTLHFSFDGTWEYLGSVHNGEAGTVSDLPMVIADKVAYQDVECGSKVVNQIAEYQGELRGYGRHLLGPTHFFPVGLKLANDSIRLRLKLGESGVRIGEISKVLFGPCDLGPRSGRWCSRHG